MRWTSAVSLSLYPKTQYRPPRLPDQERLRESWLKRELTAPLPAWQEAGFMAGRVASMAATSRVHGWKAAAIGLGLVAPYALLVNPLHERLERRRGRELGLTIETSPEQSPGGCLLTVPWLLLWSVYIHGRHIRPAPWPNQLAALILSEWYRRRSWKRAMARVRAGAPPTSPTRTSHPHAPPPGA